MTSPRLLVPALLALVLAACGGGDGVTVDDAWARTSAAGQTNGAVYFDLTVDADDMLLGASVPADVAVRAEIHEVVPADDDMDGMDGDDIDDMSGDAMDAMDGMDGMSEMDGAMTMRQIEGGLALTAGETVTFEPGGYHVMLFDLADPLAAGEEIDVTLELAEAGPTTVTVEVAETAP